MKKDSKYQRFKRRIKLLNPGISDKEVRELYEIEKLN